MYFTQRNKLIIKKIINANFTFSDLSRRFEGVDSSTGNIYCPFHDNTHSPAAKMYWDETNEIWIIHCFGECHRNFTTYDYVNLILCRRYEQYKNPLEFLKKNMNITDLKVQIDYYKKNLNELESTSYEDKVTYINNIYNNSEDTADYIEKLYTN